MCGWSRYLVAGAIGACAGGTAMAGSITNGGFETGDFTGWTASGAAYVTDWEYVRDPLNLSAFVPAGNEWLPFAQGADATYFASLWSNDGVDTFSRIEQTFAGTAGQVLRFRYFQDFGEDGSAFDRLFGELEQPTLGTHTFFDDSRDDEENYDWKLVTYVLPETGMYTLRFGADDGDPLSWESIMGIDNVILTDGVIIPLPTAAGLGGLGLIVVAGRRSRPRRA